MEKTIIIVGAGKGLSKAIAEKFGAEGFQVGLISRNASNLEALVGDLKKRGISASYAVADAGIEAELENALMELRAILGWVDLLVYNAAVLKRKDILEESAASLSADFTLGVAHAQHSVKVLLEELKVNKGAVLLTGGGLAKDPSSAYGSLSLVKAGLRNLAFQLHERLKPEGVFVGTVTINGMIDPSSETYAPERLAEDFWTLASEREIVEIQR
ncbi:SDR family NAD(P)-dependent oxidoreductase [Pedobacter sp. AW31-3R]|uniref:SDR family NAD(P)-dependent oxidoreductase n=1 Tax=Pedobacter sp. AW31-3R TaxID=3445781 RepID=UPI003FA09E78